MSTRGWTRGADFQIYDQTNIAGLTSASTGMVTFANTDQDTLLRARCSASFTVVFDETVGGGPSNGWWADIHPFVCVGRGEVGEPAMQAWTNPDPRITGIARLDLCDVTTVQPVPLLRAATYKMQQEIDTHGMRKPENPGTLPIGMVSIQAYPIGGVFAPTFLFEAKWMLHLSTLWETP